ncbi:hypothetical protein KUTeg_007738 [Tegillarca granosa]|uniref:Tc1-like transposase DDE domain-containing protein n=1 Tax=Tegillarca granosa TaxID=220873 RepID=A0ABQ9FE32_TEGGR|nr:hypothetical protein KUTeg_007738 [Tegillarca granosa]
MERASAMTGVPRRTLSRLKSFGIETKQADKKQRSDKFFIDDFDICVIRRTIINMYLNKRVLPTINAIYSEIINKIDFKGGKTILTKLLKEMGFNWKKCSTNRKILMEKTDIVSKRINYLREIKKLRETGHNIIYMDETIDYTLREHGHKILRLPPYHADLNPIELIWADLKSYVASQNLKFKLSDLQQLAEKQLKDMSTEKWKRCVENVKKIETDYWKNDIAVDEEIEKFVINLDDTDSSE